jgi:hypothetical protein
MSQTENRYDWEEIGTLPGKRLSASPAAVTYTHDFTKPYIFTIADSGEFVVATLLSVSPRRWFFHNFAEDPGTPHLRRGISRRPAAIVHNHDGRPHLYGFAISSDNNLIVCFWNQEQWQWRSLGRPNGEN